MKKCLAILLALMMPVALSSCSAKLNVDNAGSLMAFEYSYWGDTAGWDYKIIPETTQTDETGWRFVATYADFGVMVDAYVDAEVLSDLADIIDKNNIFAWNGFNKRRDNVADGAGFSLMAEFSNGTLRAEGHNSSPEDFRGGHKALDLYLQALVRSLVQQ